MNRRILSPDGSASEWPEGTPIGDILDDLFPRSGAIAALLDNDLVSLTDPLRFGGAIRAVLPDEPGGIRVYDRTACFLLSMAAHQAMPSAHLRIHNAAGPALYCTLEGGDLATLQSALSEIVAKDLPILSAHAPYLAALESLESHGLTDKANLLRHRSNPAVRLSQCDTYLDLWLGPLAPRTGLFSSLRLEPHDSAGFLFFLRTPDSIAANSAAGLASAVAHEHIRWGDILGIHTVGDLNEAIATRRAPEIVQMVEALHDQRISDIAVAISTRAEPVRLVLIAGPSSAGKTTTARRLVTHLRVRGLRPILISTDDYFLPPSKTPRDPSDDSPDFEHIEALDLPALNEDLNALLAGRSVRHRVYSFLRQCPTYPGDTLTLAPDGILLIEGLHALNPTLTDQVPDSVKFRLFLNAMTQLGLHETARVSTTDNRLLRRIVRDYRTRGKTPLETLRSWPQVRRGEDRWIFPFQTHADTVFNTSLDYELAVIKPLVEPLLTQIKPDVPEYDDARRLLFLLSHFHALGTSLIPSDSILRETIGESLFE